MVATPHRVPSRQLIIWWHGAVSTTRINPCRSGTIQLRVTMKLGTPTDGA